MNKLTLLFIGLFLFSSPLFARGGAERDFKGGGGQRAEHFQKGNVNQFRGVNNNRFKDNTNIQNGNNVYHRGNTNIDNGNTINRGGVNDNTVNVNRTGNNYNVTGGGAYYYGPGINQNWCAKNPAACVNWCTQNASKCSSDGTNYYIISP